MYVAGWGEAGALKRRRVRRGDRPAGAANRGRNRPTAVPLPADPHVSQPAASAGGRSLVRWPVAAAGGRRGAVETTGSPLPRTPAAQEITPFNGRSRRPVRTVVRAAVP